MPKIQFCYKRRPILAIMTTKPSLSCLLCFLCMLAIPIFPFLKCKEFLTEEWAPKDEQGSITAWIRCTKQSIVIYILYIMQECLAQNSGSIHIWKGLYIYIYNDNNVGKWRYDWFVVNTHDHDRLMECIIPSLKCVPNGRALRSLLRPDV